MKPKERNFLEETMHTSKRTLFYVFVFSFAINLLMLAMPIYTLQVLDRVISSGSESTLAMLTIVMVGLFAAFGAFYLVRRMTMIKLGEWFENEINKKMLALSISRSIIAPAEGGSRGLRDVSMIKSFLSGEALTAFFDAPWSVIYLAVIFFIHPILAVVTFIGGIILLIAAIINEKAAKKPLVDSIEHNNAAMVKVETFSRNSEVIEAMGMMNSVTNRWKSDSDKASKFQTVATSRSAFIMSFAKTFRMVLQIAVMGIGALLVLQNEITVGAIIACSILSGRALAPFEAAISSIDGWEKAKKSYANLNRMIDTTPVRHETIDLPTPIGSLSVEKVIYAVPGTNKAVLKPPGLTFQLAAGDILGIIGSSASGKTTLAKLMMGVIKPHTGVVRLDGADVFTWSREDFGKHTGYLPQGVELFSGTVRDNIARMREDATDEDIITAAKISGTHEMILHLPDGYNTEIGIGGTNLSAGQRQRVGLARAFFGSPKFVVLDEPNSNLDEVGESALVAAIRNAKSLGITVVVIAHRQSVLSFVDYIMIMADGAISDFGEAKEIIGKHNKRVMAAQQSQAAQLAAAKGKMQQSQQAVAANIHSVDSVESATKNNKSERGGTS